MLSGRISAIYIYRTLQRFMTWMKHCVVCTDIRIGVNNLPNLAEYSLILFKSQRPLVSMAFIKPLSIQSHIISKWKSDSNINGKHEKTGSRQLSMCLSYTLFNGVVALTTLKYGNDSHEYITYLYGVTLPQKKANSWLDIAPCRNIHILQLTRSKSCFQSLPPLCPSLDCAPTK